MSAEEGYLFRNAASLAEGDDGECASAAGLPIDREVFRVCLFNLSARVLPASWVGASADLDQISVPCIRRDAEVIVALFLLRNRVSAYLESFGGNEGCVPSSFRVQRRDLASIVRCKRS